MATGLIFGKPWMALMDLTPESMQAQKKGMGARYGAAFVSALVMAFVTAMFVYFVNATTFQSGMIVGFWIWLGYIATVMLGSILWENKPLKLYYINVSHYLVVLLLTGGLLAMWK